MQLMKDAWKPVYESTGARLNMEPGPRESNTKSSPPPCDIWKLPPKPQSQVFPYRGALSSG